MKSLVLILGLVCVGGLSHAGSLNSTESDVEVAVCTYNYDETSRTYSVTWTLNGRSYRFKDVDSNVIRFGNRQDTIGYLQLLQNSGLCNAADAIASLRTN